MESFGIQNGGVLWRSHRRKCPRARDRGVLLSVTDVVCPCGGGVERALPLPMSGESVPGLYKMTRIDPIQVA